MQQVIISDSIAFIALNHYLKNDYPGYSAIPFYMRSIKTPTRIPIDIAEALIRINRPYSPIENTLLEKMMYEGAVALVTCTATGQGTASVLGIDQDKADEVDRRLGDWWQQLATERLIYSTSTGDIARFIEPSPSTTLGNMTGPGQTGRIIGLAIARAYIKNNPDTPVAWLLTDDYYGKSQQNLIRSGFTPRTGN